VAHDAAGPYREGGGEYDVTPFDRDPSSSGPPEQADDRQIETSRTETEGVSLPARFCRGEPEAVADVAALVGKVVRVRGHYIPYDERPDVIQEAIVDLVRSVKKRTFDGDEMFHGFVRMVAHRRCVDWTRQATRLARIEPALKRLVQPEDTLVAKERRDLAVDVFARLKKPCREVLALRVGRGLTFGQMAPLLGRTEGALRTQSSYCLQQARAILNRMRRRQKLVNLTDWRKR
jgi:RNA polymerase sigma factor (sigma-70 family)